MIAGGGPTSAAAGSLITGVSVIVQDQAGKALAGQALAVTVSGGGSVIGAANTTQAGPTSLGTWTLGTKIGPNTMTISSGSLPVLTITVAGTAGPATKILTASPLNSVAIVGATFPFFLQLFDQFDNPAGGSVVNISVTGGGSLSANSAIASINGNVTVPTWTLGNVRGTNTLTATTGAASLVLTVVAQSGPASGIVISQGEGQVANAGTAVQAPVVKVVDRFGNGVARQVATFSVATGGGTLSGVLTVVSDTNGVIPAPTWVLGKRNIPQQLLVSAAGLAQPINATIKTSMTITLRFFGVMTDAQKAVFLGAAQRISAMVTRGAEPVQVTGFDIASFCDVTGGAPITEVIDGIVIYASIGPIDGPNKILAESGPCAFRGASSRFLPAVAVMNFDISDLASLSNGGSLEDVATHEMMHALGFGTLWGLDGLVSGTVNVDPRYIGASGIAGCRLNGGTTTCASTVPVENTGGAGTAGGHWRETTFTNELMTGFLNPGTDPLSSMSISSMADLGYEVNLSAADNYSVLAAIRSPAGVRTMPENWERLLVPGPSTKLEPSGGVLRTKVAP